MDTERYEVVINGITTVLNLTPEDAEARGLAKPEQKARTAPNKSRTPKTK